MSRFPSVRTAAYSFLLFAAVALTPHSAVADADSAWVSPSELIALLVDDPSLVHNRVPARQTLETVSAAWRAGYAPMLLEISYFVRDPALRRSLVTTLERNTRQALGNDVNAWYEWIWNQTFPPHPDYAQFKSQLYGYIDPRFTDYFSRERVTKIRLDEVRWGGVKQDGIPPLRSPKMLSAEEATYLDDSDVVFGLEVNGDVRAYPKRILAWHELFTDKIGGVPVAGVYCTLCGTVILYETDVAGVQYELGTSGFLYRSNKLMYDRATQSLWNTIWGRPVIGPLADQQIQLPRRSVVTTTWGEWRRRHPQTLVLSIDTGHQRDYSEGAAYRDYFATDRLMFNVPRADRRLKNKDEVFTLLTEGEPHEALAISADFLAKNRIHHDQLGGVALVVFTDRSGANRAYRSDGVEFKRWNGKAKIADTAGVAWSLSEDRLVAADGRVLERLPGQRAFWFGWHAAFPETRLVR